MPLTNFGAILNFAETLENQDCEFYSTLARNPACTDHQALFAALAADSRKNIKTIQRTRRENVTEMILEPIQNFTREAYSAKGADGETLAAAQALEACRALCRKAVDYYTAAADKISALPEVSRALKRLAKKRRAHLAQLDALA